MYGIGPTFLALFFCFQVFCADVSSHSHCLSFWKLYRYMVICSSGYVYYSFGGSFWTSVTLCVKLFKKLNYMYFCGPHFMFKGLILLISMKFVLFYIAYLCLVYGYILIIDFVVPSRCLYLILISTFMALTCGKVFYDGSNRSLIN
ncbi:hypothetical protein CsatB_007116 [Cannabis sativa]